MRSNGPEGQVALRDRWDVGQSPPRVLPPRYVLIHLQIHCKRQVRKSSLVGKSLNGNSLTDMK